jgi:AraC family transcriptional regulator
MHHRNGEPLGPDYSGAVSRVLVDRIVTLQAAAEARRLDAARLEREACRLVEALIDADLQNPPSVTALASKVGMGIARFVRAFRTTFETSPHRYVQRRRLQRARELLLGTDASITSIALDTGFASHAHFSTVFRAETGMTPSRYRRAGPPAAPPRPPWLS